MSFPTLFSLLHQTAVITGAARGLGLSFATVLASFGANIAAIDILETPSPALHDLATQHGVKVKYYRCDITSLPQINNIMLKIDSDFSSIDININNRGNHRSHLQREFQGQLLRCSSMRCEYDQALADQGDLFNGESFQQVHRLYCINIHTYPLLSSENQRLHC
jgi:NAD(P)-dependent dehydrogenase (short-subunit alcohol dehydrogenase family)